MDGKNENRAGWPTRIGFIQMEIDAAGYNVVCAITDGERLVEKALCRNHRNSSKTSFPTCANQLKAQPRPLFINRQETLL